MLPAGGLGAALDDVAGHDAGGHPVPVVHGPAELVDHGRQGHAGVGHPAGDDDLAAGVQGGHHRLGAQVDVGRGDPAPHVGEVLAGLHVGELLARGGQLVEAAGDVVAVDHAHLQIEALAPGQGQDLAAQAHRD